MRWHLSQSAALAVGIGFMLVAGVVYPVGAEQSAPSALDTPDGQFALEQQLFGRPDALDHLERRNAARMKAAGHSVAKRGSPMDAGAPDEVGQWSEPSFPSTPTIGIHAVVLRTGKV